MSYRRKIVGLAFSRLYMVLQRRTVVSMVPKPSKSSSPQAVIVFLLYTTQLELINKRLFKL